MTTAARLLAYVLGVALAAGLVVLAVAGVTAATAVLVTGAAVIVMIALGGVMGGRSTPDRDPVPINPADRPTRPEGQAAAASHDPGAPELLAPDVPAPRDPADPGHSADGGTMEQ